ncbi:hypothetical protein TNCT1_41550 [Streptomyces sp. 1-11]|nr:hypothetical protein TNCT1_41550 [Streptomyces sp. 1-11]
MVGERGGARAGHRDGVQVLPGQVERLDQVAHARRQVAQEVVEELGEGADLVAGEVAVGQQVAGELAYLRQQEQPAQPLQQFARPGAARPGHRGQEGVGRLQPGVHRDHLEGGRGGAVPPLHRVARGSPAQCGPGPVLPDGLGPGQQPAQVPEVRQPLDAAGGFGLLAGRLVLEEHLGGRLHPDHQVVALGGDGALDVLRELRQAVGGEQALRAAAFPALDRDVPGLPGDPALGHGHQPLGRRPLPGVTGGAPEGPAGERRPVQEGHGVGRGDALQQPPVVRAVGVDRDALARPRPADQPVFAVAHGYRERRPGSADGGAAHAQLAHGDPADRMQEPLAPVAERAVQPALGVQPAVLGLQQGLARQRHPVERGQAVVHRGPGAHRQPADPDARQQPPLVAQRGEEQEDALVPALDQEAGGDHGALRTARHAGVGHELLRAGVRGAEHEPAGRRVQFGGGLQRRGVVAVVQLGAQKRSGAPQRGEVGQVPAPGAPVVEQAAEEEVVVDARHRAQAPAAVHDRRPLVQRRQRLGVVREPFGASGRVVHQPQPLVGECGALGGAESGAVPEGVLGDEVAPHPVGALAVVAEEEPGQLAALPELRRRGDMYLGRQKGHDPLPWSQIRQGGLRRVRRYGPPGLLIKPSFCQRWPNGGAL